MPRTKKCLRDGVCAYAKIGTACGDCLTGFFGTSDGPAVYQSLALFAFLAITFALILMHRVSEGGRRAPQNPLKISRSEILCAVSWVVKYAQRVVVLCSLPVQWPDKVSALQTAHQSAGLNAETFQAISSGCLAHEQSIELLMSCRWLNPVVL